MCLSGVLEGRNRGLASLILSGAALGLALAHQVAVAAERSIVIGQVVDQHGSDLESSRDYVIGAKLYFDYVNSKGGINGQKLVQVVKDSGGEAADAIQLTRELIDHDNAMVLFGYTGEAAIRAVSQSDMLDRAGIALVSPLTGFGEGDAKTSHNMFVTRATYSTELRKIIEYFQTVSLNRFAVIATRADLAAGLGPELGRIASPSSASSQGRQPAMQLVFVAKALDPTALEGALKEAQGKSPQVLIVLGDGLDLGIVAHTLADKKFALPVVGLSLVNSRVVLQVAGTKDANGIVLSQVVPNPLRGDTPVTREHLAFMKKYLDEPPSHLTLEGFMAAKALVEVLRDAATHGDDRAAVLRALKSHAAVDVGGLTVDYAINQAPSVELSMVRSDGSLLN